MGFTSPSQRSAPLFPWGSRWALLGSSLLLVGLLLAFVVPQGGSRAPAGLAQAPSCAPASGTVVCIQPVNQVAETGTDFNVDIVVDNVSNLGGFQATIPFDPSLMSFAHATYGSFMGSTGRDVNCFPEKPAPTPTPASASPTPTPTPTVGMVELQLTCVTTPPRGPPGPGGANGSGVLVTVTFSPLSPGFSPLELVDTIITNPQGNPMPVTTQNGSVTVEQGPTPTPCDGVCPTATVTPTPTQTPTPGLGPTVVRPEPLTQTHLLGETFTTDIVVDSVQNLSAFEFVLAIDPSVVTRTQRRRVRRHSTKATSWEGPAAASSAPPLRRAPAPSASLVSLPARRTAPAARASSPAGT